MEIGKARTVGQEIEMKNSNELNEQAGLRHLNTLPKEKKEAIANLKLHEDNDLRKHFYSTIGELSSSTNPQAAKILETLLQNIGTRDEAKEALNVADKANLRTKKRTSRERDYNEGPLADRFEDSFTPENKRRLT